MKALPRYVIVVAIAILAFWGDRYLFPSSSTPETAQINCSFVATQQNHPSTVPNLPRAVNFNAGLNGKSVHDGVVLWHASGIATYKGGNQKLEGAVFLSPTNKVRGLHLYRDRYPHEGRDLRIATLNEDGILDWNERAAFIYAEGSLDKLAHRFDYRCNVRNGEEQ